MNEGVAANATVACFKKERREELFCIMAKEFCLIDGSLEHGEQQVKQCLIEPGSERMTPEHLTKVASTSEVPINE